MIALGYSLLAKVVMEDALVGEKMKQSLSAKEIELLDKTVLVMKYNLKN